MTIGGYDIYFKFKDMPYPELEAGLLEVCRKHWPQTVTEFDERGGLTLEARSDSNWAEFFVYKTQGDMDLWDKMGATEKPGDPTFNTMIYFIIDKRKMEMSMVVDDPVSDQDITDIILGIKDFCCSEEPESFLTTG